MRFRIVTPKVKHTSKFPVESVTWNEAAKFCKKTDVNEMALPTEAQWEYACRAGTETKYHFGDEITSKNANANIKRELKCGPSNVASYAANRFGLYDMHGSVWEWCQDGYRKDYEKLKGKDPVEEHTSIRHLCAVGAGTVTPTSVVLLIVVAACQIVAISGTVSAWLSRRDFSPNQEYQPPRDACDRF